MDRFTKLTINCCFIATFLILFNNLSSQTVTSQKTMETMVLANKYFMDKCPYPGKAIMTDRELPSNIWTRSVYYEGLMALYKLNPDQVYLNYTLLWSDYHKWGLRDGIKTRNADDQCCGQTYVDLYILDRYKEQRIKDIKACIDSMIVSDKIDEWSRIDELQMAMPVFARLGFVYRDEGYFDKMNEMYLYTKLKHGTNGLYSTTDHLWWRDKDFVPPFKEPNGEGCFWSRGNGWVAAALVRTMQFLPKNSKYKKEYIKTLEEMFEALVPLQRSDGFWNVSLKDPTHFGGKELTGTALFIYSMTWCINEGVISEKKYLPVVMKAWNALISESVHPDGFLGYVQGTGKGPADGQPVEYDNVPDFEDFGLGCFLLAGSEIYKLSKSLEPRVKEPKPEKVEKAAKDSKGSTDEKQIN
jgi:unsaturated rhamnogalacturonyl hydrolase